MNSNWLRINHKKIPKYIAFITVLCLCICIVLYKNNEEYSSLLKKRDIIKWGPDLAIRGDLEHRRIVENYLKPRMNWRTSNLGNILFKNDNPLVYAEKEKQDKTYNVLIWKFWDKLSARHVYNFRKNINKTDSPDILTHCSVKNCVFTGDDKILSKVDVVVVHVQRGQLPEVKSRNPEQIWIFLTDEAPTHTFSIARTIVNLNNFSNIFNWTMTYRSEADVPVPYGRTVPLHTLLQPLATNKALETLVPYWREKTKKETVSVAILASNCRSERVRLLRELQVYIELDIYGRCGTKYQMACPGHFKRDCPALRKYLFYLVIENASCREYITEKAFYHAYAKGAIPIIVGPSLEDCKVFLPPDSFIHISKYDNNWETLAYDLEKIESNNEILFAYHRWRMHFEIRNEHGYFGTKSYHYCRICEALNYNDMKKQSYTLDDLNRFFDTSLSCK